ncbi:PREDICTED: kelch-like protein 30 [Bison bison bison]|uniref:Kelch-like protein 30 n=1 Tax=Bison bison bison TaxID=43346 RepID=A0A6P3J8R9_BISBB|nr:PREDICTED: kelch-like protein 30 [Bison bison bison]
MVRNVDDLDFHLPSHAQDVLDGLQRLRSQPKLVDLTLLVGGRELPHVQQLLASEPLIRESEACREALAQGHEGALLALPQKLEEVLVVVGGRALEEEEEGAEELAPLAGNFAFYHRSRRTEAWHRGRGRSPGAQSPPARRSQASGRPRRQSLSQALRGVALGMLTDEYGFRVPHPRTEGLHRVQGSLGPRLSEPEAPAALTLPLAPQAPLWGPPRPRPCSPNAALGPAGTALGVVEVESYDPFTDTWTPIRPALKYVSNFSAAGCGGRLYLVGSSACKYNALALQCYNPVTDAWSVIASPFLPKYLSSPRCAALHGALYLVGDNTKKVYVYDPGANLWQKVQPLHSLHENGALVPLGDALYATGGRWQGMAGDYRVEMEAYDRGRDAWVRLGAMPRLWLYHGASAVFLDVSKWTQPFGPAPEP